VFAGEFTLRCADPSSFPSAGSEFKQRVLLRMDVSDASGQVWALNYGARAEEAELVGSLRGGLTISQLSWTSIDLSDIAIEPLRERVGGLIGNVRLNLSYTAGDIVEACKAVGDLRLERDVVPPSVSWGSGGVLSRDDADALFDEPVRIADVNFDVEVDGQPVEVGVMPGPEVMPGFALTFRIRPAGFWPSGISIISVHGASDLAGNTLLLHRERRTVPSFLSATLNPSFETMLAKQTWYGCTYQRAAKYTAFAQENAARELLPTEGEWLASCESGARLAGYVEPPAGATRLLIDAADVDFSVGRSVVDPKIEIVRAESRTALTRRGPERLDATPTFATFEGEVRPDDASFWLEISYDGGYYEDGRSPSGWGLVDNLRFE
jgi:hypothetical protein